ncbi:MAG: EF-hand domain-containing protein [Rhodospirillales bacterium]
MTRPHRMKRHTKAALGILVASAVIGGTAFAVDAGYRGHHGKSGERADWLFDRFDADKDGKITKAEIEASRKGSLAKYDTDKDGQLSLEEFQGLYTEIMRQRMVRMFQKLDRDGDAKVTDAELARKMDRMMARLDRDDNGEIERNELKRRHKHRDRDGDRKH